MSLILDDYQNLVKQVEDLKRDRDVAKGALGLLLKRLKTEFGCKSVEEARALLKKLEFRERKALARYTKARKVFDRKLKSGPWEGKFIGELIANQKKKLKRKI